MSGILCVHTAVASILRITPFNPHCNFVPQGVRKDVCCLKDDAFVYITRQVYQIVYLLTSTVETKMG